MLEFDSRSIRTWARLGACGAFGLALVEAACADERLYAITADLCTYSGLARFKEEYPDRFINVGIAEQNMLNMAAGMAKEGFNVFATTYGTFAAARCLDQVRVSCGYMELPVKLVGMTSGFSAGILGPTHMGLEDIAALRSIPNLVILSPADTTETVKATLAAARCSHPVYLRLTGVMGGPVVYRQDYDFEIGKAIRLCEGSDVLVAATGTMVAVSLEAARLLREKGIGASVFDVHTIKPLDTALVKEACSKGYRLVVSAEEHSAIGGLGSALSEEMDCFKDKPPLLRVGVNDFYPHAAPYPELIKECELTAEAMANKIAVTLENYAG